jgi:hypothetical protein
MENFNDSLYALVLLYFLAQYFLAQHIDKYLSPTG